MNKKKLNLIRIVSVLAFTLLATACDKAQITQIIDIVVKNENKIELICKGKVSHFTLYANGVTAKGSNDGETYDALTYIEKKYDTKSKESKWILNFDGQLYLSQINEKDEDMTKVMDELSILNVAKDFIYGRYINSNKNKVKKGNEKFEIRKELDISRVSGKFKFSKIEDFETKENFKYSIYYSQEGLCEKVVTKF